MNDRRIRSKV